MKVNQIVNEHKKGVRAKIYNKKATVKAQGSVPLYGPDKQEAKLTPYKPKKIDETEEIKVGPAPANMQQATDPTGKVIATGPADKIAAVAQAAKDGVDFTPNTDDKGAPTPMEETGEDDDLAPGKMTMPLDKFMQIADENNKENGFNVDLEKIKPMLVMTPSGEVDAGLTLQKIAGFFQGPEWTQFVEDMRKLIAFAEQNRPGPTKTAAAGNAPYNPMNRPEAKLGTGAFDSSPDVTLSTRVQETADNQLLQKMLVIAGLR